MEGDIFSVDEHDILQADVEYIGIGSHHEANQRHGSLSNRNVLVVGKEDADLRAGESATERGQARAI